MDLKQVIQSIESGETIRLRLITANVAKGNGGQVLEIPKARIARNTTIPRPSTTGGAKSAKHSTNFTRNIEMLPSKRIITIHPILVTHVNQEAVV